MFKGKELTKNLVKRESIDSLTRWPEKTKSFLFLFWYRYQHRFTWKVWAALFVVVFGGVGFLATWQLLNMQKSPNCPRPIAQKSSGLSLLPPCVSTALNFPPIVAPWQVYSQQLP